MLQMASNKADSSKIKRLEAALSKSQNEAQRLNVKMKELQKANVRFAWRVFIFFISVFIFFNSIYWFVQYSFVAFVLQITTSSNAIFRMNENWAVD